MKSGLHVVLAVTLCGLSQNQLWSQDQTKKDPSQSLEFRLANPTLLEAEYGWQVLPTLSADALIQTSRSGFSAGLTFAPILIAFLQLRIGYPVYAGLQLVDGPPQWRPDLMYGYRVGMALPGRNSRMYINISVGKLWVVDWDYCYTCGGFPPPGTVVKPITRDQYEIFDMFSVGIGGAL
jgi:hypothetical protein